MKKGLLLLTTLLSVTMLASCGDSDSSTNPTTTTDPALDDWTAEQKAAIQEVLGQVEIPFFSLENSEFVSSVDDGYIAVVKESATVSDLQVIENAIKADADWTIETGVGAEEGYPGYGLSSYNYALVDDAGNRYQALAQYGLYTSDDDFGKVSEGSMEFAVYLEQILDDNSVEGASYAEVAKAAKDYFAKFNMTLELPESVATSATAFEMLDMRYVYFTYYGLDIGPMVTIDLYGALESEVADVVKTFTDLGYVESEDDYGTFYAKGEFSVSVDYYEADADNEMPEEIMISIAPLSEE